MPTIHIGASVNGRGGTTYEALSQLEAIGALLVAVVALLCRSVGWMRGGGLVGD